MAHSKYYNIAIIGRPNVGKSSIFNFLIKKREAIVKNEIGTTKDFRSYVIDNLKIWDTPGVFKVSDIPFDIDCVFFVVENNILEYDKIIYSQLLSKFKNIFVIINKIDLGEDFDYSYFHDYIKISVKKNINLKELKNIFDEMILSTEEKNEDKKTWAIIGKPNVGKSSLINKIINFDLHNVKDEIGTTKEYLPVDMDLNVILDTPGQYDKPIFPHYNNIFGIIFMMDLNLTRQDYKLINLAIKRNKPFFIIINKTDLSKHPNELKLLQEKLHNYFNTHVLKISCTNDKGIDKVNKTIKQIEINYFKKVTTNELNKWIISDIKKVEPKIKYMTQIQVASPKFYCDYQLKQDKEKMLKRKLSQKFNFFGIPLKIIYKKEDH